MRASENQDIRGLADTIGHEMRHAQQVQYAQLNPDSAMAQSLNNYKSTGQGYSYEEYRYQLCEADAFEAGESFSNWFMSILGF